MGDAPASLAEAQQLLLAAVLAGTELPGASSPVRLPDLDFVLAHRPVIVAAEHLADEEVVEGLPIAVQVRPEAALRAGDSVDIGYLAFEPPVWENDTLLLVLQAKIAPASTSQRPLGLSGLQVRLREVEGHWKAEGDPVAFAS